jgi:hypothetical protein
MSSEKRRTIEITVKGKKKTKEISEKKYIELTGTEKQEPEKKEKPKKSPTKIDWDALSEVQQKVEYMRWEKNLKVGNIVYAKWTNSGNYWAGKGKITKVNEKSFRVELLEMVGAPGGYPVGFNLTIPRFLASRYSNSNRVIPLEWVKKK